MYYDPGFILRYPTHENQIKFPKFEEHKKLAKVFYEAEKWGEILGIGEVGALNDEVVTWGYCEFIRVAEALHEKKIANIADMIIREITV